MFEGSIPALITPFKNGEVDDTAFRAFVDWQIRNGSTGLVPCGTTGESPTLSAEEHHRVIRLCVETANRRVPVIAGVGTNNTATTIERAGAAQKAGVDGLLVVTPYYNKPDQDGLYAHFRAVAEAVDRPIIIYNIPGRSVVDMSVETMARLAELDNIVGIKDATGDLARVSRQRAACGEKFVQLSGEDGTALAFNAMGGHGCISVTANVAPALCAEFQALTQSGDFRGALALQDRLMPLHDAMFCAPSPGPAKYAAHRLGLCEPDVRLPLTGLSPDQKQRVDAAIVHAGLKPVEMQV